MNRCRREQRRRYWSLEDGTGLWSRSNAEVRRSDEDSQKHFEEPR